NYFSDLAALHAQVDGEAATMARQLAAGLALPLWNFDQPVVDQEMQNLMQIHEVAGVLVRQKDVGAAGGIAVHGRGRDEHWKVAAIDHAPSYERMVMKEQPIVLDGQELGSVQVFVTPVPAERALRRTLLSVSMRILLLDLLLIVILYFL